MWTDFIGTFSRCVNISFGTSTFETLITPPKILNSTLKNEKDCFKKQNIQIVKIRWFHVISVQKLQIIEFKRKLRKTLLHFHSFHKIELHFTFLSLFFRCVATKIREFFLISVYWSYLITNQFATSFKKVYLQLSKSNHVGSLGGHPDVRPEEGCIASQPDTGLWTSICPVWGK